MQNLIIRDSSFLDLLSRVSTDIIQRKRERNLLKAARFSVGRLGWSDVFHRERLYIMSQSIETNPARSDVSGITFRDGTPDDTHLFPQLFKWESAANTHKRMIENGDLMVLAFDKDRPIGTYLASIWQDGRKPHESDFKAIARMFDVVAGEDAISHGLYVLPDYRQRGIGAQLGIALSTLLAKHGCKRVFSVVNTENEASVRTHFKIGRDTAARIGSTQLLNFKIIRPQPMSDKPQTAKAPSEKEVQPMV